MHSANTSNVAAAAAVALTPATLLPPPQEVVMVLDATTRDDRREEIRTALRGLVARGDMLRAGDSLLVLGVLRPNKGCTDCLTGTNSAHLRDQVAIKAEKYQEMLRYVATELRTVAISVTLKIVSSYSPAKDVIVQEVNSSKAAWVVLDRLFRRDLRHFERFIACKVAALDNHLSVLTLKTIRTSDNRCKGEGVEVLAATVTFDEAAGPSKTLGDELQHASFLH
ncbi:unnamed protein product [Urochloa humidicola]